jgi:hypothetical protein
MPIRLAANRVECLNQVRFGRICGAHLGEGQTWCPVCGAPTTTRPLDAAESLVSGPGARSTDGRRVHSLTTRADVLYLEWLFRRQDPA